MSLNQIVRQAPTLDANFKSLKVNGQDITNGNIVFPTVPNIDIFTPNLIIATIMSSRIMTKEYQDALYTFYESFINIEFLGTSPNAEFTDVQMQISIPKPGNGYFTLDNLTLTQFTATNTSTLNTSLCTTGTDFIEPTFTGNLLQALTPVNFVLKGTVLYSAPL